jgi:hypothetical protein
LLKRSVEEVVQFPSPSVVGTPDGVFLNDQMFNHALKEHMEATPLKEIRKPARRRTQSGNRWSVT